jgi:uncharacterized protein (TIGR02145 family)
MIDKTHNVEKKNNVMQNIGVFASSLLVAFVAVYFYSPIIGTHADQLPDSGTNGTASGTLKSTATVKEVIGISTQSPLTPIGSDNSFISSSGAVSVETNSSYGYSLYIEDLDDDTSLRYESDPENGYITSEFDGTKTNETMPENSWGYSLTDTDFSRIPAYGDGVILKKTTTPSSGSSDIVSINFGIKVGSGIPYGYYYDKIMFTVIPNTQDGGLRLETMQNFYCSALELPDQTTGTVSSVVLTDARDSRTYRVARMNDGNCWMLDDLAIKDIYVYESDTSLSAGSSSYRIPASSSSWSLDKSDYTYYDSSTSKTYYNYNVAAAGIFYYNDPNIVSTSTGELENSICPSGWTIPSYEDWNKLMRSYNEPEGGFNKESALELPINLSMTGMYDYDLKSASNQNTMGGWWLRQKEIKGVNRDVVLLDDSGLRTASYDARNGFAIRCIAQRNLFYNTSSSHLSRDDDD